MGEAPGWDAISGWRFQVGGSLLHFSLAYSPTRAFVCTVSFINASLHAGGIGLGCTLELAALCFHTPPPLISTLCVGMLPA